MVEVKSNRRENKSTFWSETSQVASFRVFAKPVFETAKHAAESANRCRVTIKKLFAT